MLLSSQNKVFRADPNYIQKMQINWENFVIVREKEFHVETRVSSMTCLFELFLTRRLDLVSKMFSSVSFFITIMSNTSIFNTRIFFPSPFILNIMIKTSARY